MFELQPAFTISEWQRTFAAFAFTPETRSRC
jgi:hypothetical protein